jgi:small subunit ribosomal protein S16
MLKLRLKKIGRKRQPSYRLVVMDTKARRDGRPIDEVGYYSPLTKEGHFETEKIVKWLENGVKPTESVQSLLRKAKILATK